MKTIAKASLALAAALAINAVLPAIPAFCAEKMAGVIIYVEGDVQFKRGGAGAYAGLRLNEALQPGDVIKTGAGAKASVATKGGAEIRINQNSIFEIPAEKKARDTFNLSIGQVWSRMLHKKARLSVRTPAAVCAIRGTEADIEQKEIMTVKVYEGHVDLHNGLGKQALRAGQISTVSGANAAPAAPRQMNSAEQGKWQDTIEVRDLGKYLERLGLENKVDQKGLQLKVGKDGKAKDINIKLKKK